MRKTYIRLIRVYKIAISPYLKTQCKFFPTCSQYSALAVEKYGLFVGILKTCGRILRCNPFSNGGVDFP